MNISGRLIKVWIILFLPCIVIRLVFNYQTLQNIEARRPIVNYVGSTFQLTGFQDRNKTDTEISFSHSEYTIIDFWHKRCPPCIDEMKEFKSLIEGRDKEISIVSVSINSQREWLKLFEKKDPTFYFLFDSVNNWRHVVMKSAMNPKLNNAIPSDNIQKLATAYQTNSFPTYLVVDKTGTIVAVPSSAVAYLQTNILGENKYMSFIFSKSAWFQWYLWIPQTLIWYSGVFWIGLLLIVFVRKLKSQRQPV